MVRMAAEAEAQIEQFSQQNLANLAWAYGKLSFYQRSLMDAVALQAVIKVKASCLMSSDKACTVDAESWQARETALPGHHPQWRIYLCL